MAGSYSLYAKHNNLKADEAKNKLFTESIIRYAEQLQISNNPRDLAVASQLLDFHEMVKKPNQKENPMHVEQLRRAVTLSPKDADIAWLEAMGCGRLKAACNRENAVSRLQQMQPDNLAVHLLAFNQADIVANETQRLATLQAMANSRYSDIHYFSIGKLYFEALRGWHTPTKMSAYEAFGDDIDQSPVTDDEHRKVMAAGYSIAMGLPALQQITTYCKNENLAPDELQNCQKIAEIMIKDKTLIMHRIGLRIGVAVFKKEPEASQWREAYRTSYWQLSGHNHNRSIKETVNIVRRPYPTGSCAEASEGEIGCTVERAGSRVNKNKVQQCLRGRTRIRLGDKGEIRNVASPKDRGASAIDELHAVRAGERAHGDTRRAIQDSTVDLQDDGGLGCLGQQCGRHQGDGCHAAARELGEKHGFHGGLEAEGLLGPLTPNGARRDNSVRTGFWHRAATLCAG